MGFMLWNGGMWNGTCDLNGDLKPANTNTRKDCCYNMSSYCWVIRFLPPCKSTYYAHVVQTSCSYADNKIFYFPWTEPRKWFL